MSDDDENGVSCLDGDFDHFGRQVREKYGSRCAFLRRLDLRPLDLGQGAAVDPGARCGRSETLN